jgi:CheY-like chemotaxis protein
MSFPGKVLVIDDNPESRFLLTRTLVRKFPRTVLLECSNAETAVRTAGEERIDVIVLHRAADVNGIELVQRMRSVSRTVPIIMVSGIDRSAEARTAGADFFLSYDEWLRIGTVVADLLSLPPPSDGEGALTATPFPVAPRAEIPPSRLTQPASEGEETDRAC